MTKNIPASVRDRLLNRARQEKTDYNQLLTRYGMERFLYRLSISAYGQRFYLKGALLFDLWFDEPHRPTRDIDLLGFGAADIDQVKGIFQELCLIPCGDGIVFDPGTITVEEIRKEARYDGIRVKLLGTLDGARCPIQVDIGYGDAITPGPEKVDYPVLLEDMPAPHLIAYPKETVIAEKLEAMVTLGMANSRLKDYYDIYVLLSDAVTKPDDLRQAIGATFERRQTRLAPGVPAGISDDFAKDADKQRQWQAFLKKNKLSAVGLELVIEVIRSTLGPLLPVPSAGQ